METPWPPRKATIHLVDDDPARCARIGASLEACCAHDVTCAGDVAAAIDRLRHGLPDLVLVYGALDRATEQLFQELQLLLPVGDHVPVIVVTDDPDPAHRQPLLELGVADVLVEPVADAELCHRVRNHLATRLVVSTLQHTAEGLRQQLEERDAELERRAIEQLEQLQLALAARDPGSSQRADRIGTGAWMLAIASGSALETAEQLRLAAPLHDVGRLGLPDELLHKRGPLTGRERRMMERHTLIGARLLGASHAPLLELAASIALSHHERWDGDGYPYGIVGERIPRAARIVAVVEAFDALTTSSGRRPAGSLGRATDELERLAGTQLDPDLVRVFVRDCVPSLRAATDIDDHDRLELIVDLVGNGARTN